MATIHLSQAFKVDIFVFGSRAYDREAFHRRARMPFGAELQRSAYVQTPEDVVLAKLKWYRIGGEVSDLQWRDVLGILKMQAGSLYEAYLHRWAAEEGLQDLLDRALLEA